MSVFDKIKENVERGDEHLGTLFWWSLSENHVPHARLVELANNAGFDEKYILKPVSPIGAFRKAIRHVSKGVKKDLLIRTVDDNPTSMFLSVVMESRLAGVAQEAYDDLSYAVLEKFRFDKDTGKFSSFNTVNTPADYEPLAPSVTAAYVYHTEHDTEDIRRIISNFLKVNGVALRQAGGVYFVPAHHQDSLDSLCTVLKDTGSNATYQLKVFDTAHAKETLAAVAQNSLEEEIRQIEQQLDKFAFEKARESTLERKLEGFEELRNRAAMFASVLNFKTSVIEEKINRVKAVVSGHIIPEKEVEEEAPVQQGMFDNVAGF